MFYRSFNAKAMRVFPLVIVLMAIAVLLLPGGSVQAQQAATIIQYNENDTVPVITLTATDPEGASPILWSVLTSDSGNQDIPGEVGPDNVMVGEFEDHAMFEISANGVLAFRNPPNFEAMEATGDDNDYKVVVQASDGTKMSWFKVTVNVTDEEEQGSLELRPTNQTAATLLQPQVGVGITAHSLTDPDGTGTSRNTSDIPAGDTTLQWYRTASRMSMGTKINGETADAYTPKAGAQNSDVGSYLRVVATYRDGRGRNKTAAVVSDHVTIGRVSNNTAPKFPGASTTRAVLEGMPKGTSIGTPITATDADNSDKLTYWLTGTDAEHFEIDARTGQLKLGGKLDFEMPAGGGGNDSNQYKVTVTVADSSGDDPTNPDDVSGIGMTNVDITVTNVDEKPTFDDSEEPQNNLSTIERAEGATELQLGTADVTYTATDSEGAVTLTLSGDDGDKFKLTDDARRQLEFKEKPDFENPGDMNGDNVYEVTVVASDGANSATMDVTVKVTNMEEPGKIEVMPAQPRIGTELTAELTDGDNVVSGPTWQWHKQDDQTSCPPADTPSWNADTRIKGATSATYTPDSDDDASCLLVMAEYVDGFYDIAEGTDDTMFDKSLSFLLGGKILGSSDNMAPEFDGTMAMRYVPEDAEADDNVGLPVIAEDPRDTLSYTLSGPDAGSFDITLEGGQITVSDDAELDHESKPAQKKVIVTATDRRNASDTITVTIHVTDVDEAPSAMEYIKDIDHTENSTPVITLTAMDPEGASPILWSLLQDATEFQDIPGLGTDGVDADDVDTADIADRALFGVSAAGVLSFKEPPSFETNESSNTSAENEYKVVVQASDGATMAPLSWFKITVNVTDVEEEGSVKLRPTAQGAATLLQPQVGVEITAHSLTDPDGVETTSATYQWYSTRTRTSMGTKINGETANAYLPKAGAQNSDVGSYLRVVATYTDGRGGGTKTAAVVSDHVTIGEISDNTAPEFRARRTARAVPEGTPKGTAIGTPITATDADSGDGDILTYWLSDDNDFDIDPRTGQLKVEEELDFEAPGETDNQYEVIVHVADSSGTTSTPDNPMGTGTVTVTITVTNVDEKPTFSTTMGASTIEIMEKVTELGADAVDTYMATDPEGAVVTFTLSGDDGDKFELGDTAPVDPATMVLAFKDDPDFENPGDMNEDNVYEVTVVASDGANAVMRDVTVKVTNITEPGKLEVMPAQPRIEVALTAELTDGDGVVSGPTWQWYKEEAGTLPCKHQRRRWRHSLTVGEDQGCHVSHLHPGL